MKWLLLACGAVLGALAGVRAMIFLQPGSRYHFRSQALL